MGVLQSLKQTMWPSGKKKLGTPIYVEEDGPILGVVDDIFVDRASGKPIAYRILASGQYIELPAEAVSDTPGGYVYRSPWFAEADALVRKLEQHELVMPELFYSNSSTASSDKRLLESALEKSPGLRDLVNEAKSLHNGLFPRIVAMEKERTKLVGQIADLTEGMATGRVDKDTYREGFVSIKRRLQVLEATMRKGEALRSRLEGIPFIRLSLNGSARRVGQQDYVGGFPHGSPFPSATGHQPDEWKRIKKVRVLKSERDMAMKETVLKQLESDIKKGGLQVEEAVNVISEDFQAIVRAHERGPEALKVEVENRLKNIKREDKILPTGDTEKPVEDILPKLSCPLCGEPLKGDEDTCPGCSADLRSLKPAGKSAGHPGKGEVFLKGGGAAKTGIVLLTVGAAMLLVRWLLH